MDYDAVVIGGGPAGAVCAGELADGGLRVALVERELVGGRASTTSGSRSWASPTPAALRARTAAAA